LLGLTRRRIRAFTVCSLLLALLLAAFILYVHVLIQRPSVQEALVERLARDTGYRIRTGRIELSLWGGIGLLANDFLAASREGADRVEAESLRVALDPGELLRGRLVPLSLELVRPRIEIDLAEGEGAGAGKPSRLRFPWYAGLESFSLQGATLIFRDRPYRAEGLSMEARAGQGDGSDLRVTSVGRLLLRDRVLPFRVHGHLAVPTEDRDLGPFRLQTTVEGIPMAWVPWPDDLAFEAGTVNARFALEGIPDQPCRVDGRATLSDVRFLLRDGEQQKPYQPPEIVILFRGNVEPSHLDLPDLTLRTGDLSLRLGLEVDLPAGESPRVGLHVQSDPMPFALMERYFPSPLLAPWVEEELFPILRSGTVRLEHLAIKGSLEEIESLDEPEHADALSMAVACSDFLVSGPTIPTPFRNVSARVRYREGTLLIADLEGLLDDSSLREGRLEVRDLLEERPVWDVLVDGDFRLPTLMKQRKIAFIPPDAFRKLERIGPMTGSLSCRAWFHYKDGWAFPKTREGLFVVRDGLVRQPELRLPLRLSRARIQVTEAQGNRFQAAGAWGGSGFEAEGRFGSGVSGFPFQSAEVTAELDMNEALPVLLRGFELPLAFEGPVATRFSLAREKGHWRCRGRVDLEEVTLRNDRISMHPPGAEDRIAFDLVVGPGEHLTLEKVLCRFRGSVLELSGGYDLDRKDLFTVEISTPSLDLEDLGLRFHDHGRPSEGRLWGDVKIIASRSDPLATVVLGKVEGEGISAQLHRLPRPIRDASFALDFSGKTIAVNRCLMRVGQSEIEVDGSLEGWRRIQGQLGVHAEFLNPDDFLPEPSDAPSSSRPVPERVNVRLEVHGRTAHWKRFRFGPLRAEVHLRDGEIRLARSRIRLPNGVLTSSGHVRGGAVPEIHLSNHIRLTDQPLRELLGSLGIDGPFLEGTLSMAAFLTLKGRNMKELLPGLSGNADVVIRHGVVDRSGVFSRILETLSLQKIFKEKPRALVDEGFYFERMKGFAVINRGVLATENFTMESPIYNAVAAGQADLVEKTVRFTLGIQPLETLDTIVSRIPIIGYALTGKDRSFLTYYFEVTGPMSAPHTRHVPFKHLGSGVAGVLKRLFLSPVRLYDTLSGLTEVPRSRPSPGQETP
jgi:hypothetical protein